MASTAREPVDVNVTRPRRNRRSAAERRREIIEAAISLADGVGLDRVTARDVGAAMGVTPGLIHHYFSTIDELIVAALQHHAEENRAAIAEQVESLPPLPALCAFVAKILDTSKTSARIWVSAWMTEARRPDLAAELALQDELDIALAAKVLERGRDAGIFDVVDVRASAVRILALLDGVIVRVSRRGHDDQSDVDLLVWNVVEHEAGLAPGTLRPASQ